MSKNIIECLQFYLFPVGVLVLRGSGESDSLVTVAELHGEEAHQGVHVVVPFEGQMEGAGEGNLLLLDGLDVYLLDKAVVGDQALVVHAVHQGLGDGHLADAGHVEAVHIIPPVNLVILVLTVLNTAHVQRCLGYIYEYKTLRSISLVVIVEEMNKTCKQNNLTKT